MFQLDKLCVTLIEGNDHMVALIRAMLRGLNMRQVHGYTDAKDAAARFGRQAPNLLIANQGPGPICGTELIRAIRRGQRGFDASTPALRASW